MRGPSVPTTLNATKGSLIRIVQQVIAFFSSTIDAVFRVGIPEMSDPMETPTSYEKKKGRDFSGQFEINRKAKQVEIDIVAMKIEEKLSS